MWTLYDRIISLADPEDRVQEILIGESWTGVIAESGKLGVAGTQEGAVFELAPLIGMSLREAAKLVKSWNLREASVGLAAINACVNRKESLPVTENPDAFLRYHERCQGKKVAVIGRFPYLETRLEPICDLYVLERKPTGRDYPDPACEYLLPEMDVVYITGSALSNKTMPRLLQLSKNAFTVLSGPSTCMDPLLFAFGADSLCGFCAEETDVFREVIQNRTSIFTCGKMVCLEKEEH